MINKVLIFVGIILIATGVIVSQLDSRVKINNRISNQEESAIVLNYVGGGLAGLGLVFAISGLVGAVRNSKRNKQNQHLLQYGIDAEGTVTFVDKNYLIKVNHTPIYSIVEYTYLDSNGTTHSRRINNVNSEIVTRNNVQVGGKIHVKYSAQNPNESVIILAS